MEVICLQDQAFYALIDEVVIRIRGDTNLAEPWKWVDDVEAMRMLNITSNTTLQEYRDMGEIIYSQPRKKVILYDRDSINDFITRHIKDPFV